MTSDSQKVDFIFTDLLKIGWFFKFQPKILGVCDFDGFLPLWKEVTIIVLFQVHNTDIFELGTKTDICQVATTPFTPYFDSLRCTLYK